MAVMCAQLLPSAHSRWDYQFRNNLDSQPLCGIVKPPHGICNTAAVLLATHIQPILRSC